MIISEIYKKYQIMPQLQEHQLRVAGVADTILDHLSLILDREEIIKVCLLHDLGNIVKFDFGYTKKFLPELVNLKRLAYWRKVQKKFRKKYGGNSHAATRNIIQEIGIGGKVLELVDCVGLHRAVENLKSEDFGEKICAYSDMRVEPQGVVSLKVRFVGLRQRYYLHPESAGKRERLEKALMEMEKQIFAQCKIKPVEITEKSILEQVESLKNFEISTKLD